MRRTILSLLLSVLVLTGCSVKDNSVMEIQQTEVKQTLKTKINKDEFIEAFLGGVEAMNTESLEVNLEELDIVDAAASIRYTIFPITEIENEEENEIINTYSITEEMFLDGESLSRENYHFSVYSDKDTEYINSIGLMTEKYNYLNCTIFVNQLALNIDDSLDISELDEKYGLIPFVEENSFGEEEKFEASKIVTGEYLSFTFWMK